jgi:hypothetical protein
MITHQIIRYQPKMKVGKDGKPKFINGSEEHRRYILERTVQATRAGEFHIEGNAYWIKGRSPNAILISICEDYKLVKWDGLKVLCMEVFIPDEQEFEMYHPSDLLKPRKH